MKAPECDFCRSAPDVLVPVYDDRKEARGRRSFLACPHCLDDIDKSGLGPFLGLWRARRMSMYDYCNAVREARALGDDL
jgi:hypothetical protein